MSFWDYVWDAIGVVCLFAIGYGVLFLGYGFGLW